MFRVLQQGFPEFHLLLDRNYSTFLLEVVELIDVNIIRCKHFIVSYKMIFFMPSKACFRQLFNWCVITVDIGKRLTIPSIADACLENKC